MLHCFRLLVIFFFLLSSVPSFGHEKIIVCGSGDSQHLLQVLARAFEKSNPDMTVLVPDSIGSSGGIRMTAEGQCDLGRTARPLKEKEGKYKLKYRLFALSPVVFIVHESVSISDLTSEQVVAILAGKIKNWQEVGGPDMKIYVAKREEGDSSREVISKNIPQLNEIEKFVGETTFSTPETVDTVSKYKGTLSFAPKTMAYLQKVRILTYNSVAATPESIQAGLYPLLSPLGLVWKGELSGISKEFVQFIEGPQGTKIILQTGAIPAQ